MDTLSRFRALPAFLIVFVLAATGGCGDSTSPQDDDPASKSDVGDSTTVVGVVQTDDRFTTLATAIDSSGLDSLLTQGGPYTLFAPTNDAFGTLPEGTVPDLLDSENRDRLRMILSQHVVDRRWMSEELAGMSQVETLQGVLVSVSNDDNTVRVGGATVLDADIVTGNGVIHVVDAVLRPPVSDDEAVEP